MTDFPRYTTEEVNKFLADTFFQVADGLNSLNHSSAKYMAYSARFYELNLVTIAQFFNWLAKRKIYKHTWHDLNIMIKFGRLDVERGKALINF